MFKGFREFLLRGNVVDLAVAVVIGAAFNTIVEKVVSSLFNPIIGMFFSADSLDGALLIDLPGGGALALGSVIGATINFLIVAAVVYFVFVMPMNKLRERTKQAEEPEAPAGETEQELLVEIRDLLRVQVGGAGSGEAVAVGADAGTASAVADAAEDPEQPRHGA